MQMHFSLLFDLYIQLNYNLAATFTYFSLHSGLNMIFFKVIWLWRSSTHQRALIELLQSLHFYYHDEGTMQKVSHNLEKGRQYFLMGLMVWIMSFKLMKQSFSQPKAWASQLLFP
ncbi:hypothetical protein V8C37DRAFT_406930 [Trichoderma ceciliae]